MYLSHDSHFLTAFYQIGSIARWWWRQQRQQRTYLSLFRFEEAAGAFKTDSINFKRKEDVDKNQQDQLHARYNDRNEQQTWNKWDEQTSHQGEAQQQKHIVFCQIIKQTYHFALRMSPEHYQWMMNVHQMNANNDEKKHTHTHTSTTTTKVHSTRDTGNRLLRGI